MSRRRQHNVRLQLAREAARLMYEEQIGQYFDAKRIAARRLYGRSGARYRPHMLPSNGEIREALLELADLTEGHQRQERLFAMRDVAAETMAALGDYHPGLIGSVASGHVRRGSDIDIHLFADSTDAVERHIHRLGWAYEMQEALVQKNGERKLYTHIHLVHTFPIELSIYPGAERRKVSRSSTDGKPIKRLSLSRVQQLLAEAHTTQWTDYQADPNLDLDHFADDHWIETLADTEIGWEGGDSR